MTTVHADYAYRRLPKARRGRQRGHRTTQERRSRNQYANRLLQGIRRMQEEQQEQETKLLQLASAERGLQFLGRTTQREYEVHGDNVAVQLNNTGLSNLERGNLARAFRNFKAALARDPDLALAHNNIGLLYLEIGEHKSAEDHLNKAIELDKDLDIAYSNRGLMRTELGEYQNASEDFERALELDPDDPMHYNNLGVLFLETGDSQTALELFYEAARLDPGNQMYSTNTDIALRENARPGEFQLVPNQSGLQPGMEHPKAMKQLLEDEDAGHYLRAPRGEK